jgi:uncharacterized integral membrane protein (TIGR00698 family)
VGRSSPCYSGSQAAHLSIAGAGRQTIALTAKILFVVCVLLCASSLISPPIALAIGLAFGLLLPHPWPAQTRKTQKLLLQASVVGLGFGMDLAEIIRVGRSGFIYTAIGIAGTLLLGQFLGRLLRVQPKAAYLISTGTAICGGSAIAAVAPVIQAGEEEMAVSLSTVFVLNSIALWIFPPIGAALGMSQSQFGLWAALAIHDTSSVVGAAAKYGVAALAIATTVKLARALWIVPVALGTAIATNSKARIQWPWFIAFFCLAAVLNTYVTRGAPVFAALFKLGRIGLTVTLFLIGAGVSLATLRRVGFRPMVQGALLWLMVGSATLFLILRGLIHL